LEDVPPDNLVEANITWETRGSKEQFKAGVSLHKSDETPPFHPGIPVASISL
jgi:hypothetical protein